MSRKIAYSGVILALNSLILILINLIPTNTLFFMMISSFLVSIIVIEFDIKTAVLFSSASIIMGFIIIHNKVYFVVYSLFFSFYGIFKYFIERKVNINIEYILKLIFANIILFVFYSISKEFILLKLNIYLLLFYQGLFLIYDKVYTSFVIYYKKNLRKKLKLK